MAQYSWNYDSGQPDFQNSYGYKQVVGLEPTIIQTTQMFTSKCSKDYDGLSSKENLIIVVTF